MILLGVDIGGTAIKAGAITPEGTILREATGPTPREGSAVEICAAAAALLQSVAGDNGGGHIGCHIGCALAAGLAPLAGRVLASPNLACLVGSTPRSALGQALGLDQTDAENIALENDANAAALGEQWLGAAKGEDNVAVLTLGTGVGGGLILGGSLVTGATGCAAELGHVLVDPQGPACGCGARGCLEAMASASAAIRRASAAQLPPADPGNLPLLCEEARRAPGPERELISAIGRDLGQGLTAVLSILDIDLFVFAGGFSAALDILEPGIRSGLDRGSTPQGRQAVRLVRAALGNRAGWIGAARRALPAAGYSQT
ncbi:MAG: ROK family protein [Planctomycetota bacterium]|nr:ROK family protein [Planctomycetota bacterium]